MALLWIPFAVAATATMLSARDEHQQGPSRISAPFRSAAPPKRAARSRSFSSAEVHLQRFRCLATGWLVSRSRVKQSGQRTEASVTYAMLESHGSSPFSLFLGFVSCCYPREQC